MAETRLGTARIRVDPDGSVALGRLRLRCVAIVFDTNYDISGVIPEQGSLQCQIDLKIGLESTCSPANAPLGPPIRESSGGRYLRRATDPAAIPGGPQPPAIRCQAPSVFVVPGKPRLITPPKAQLHIEPATRAG